jgi:sodium/hydrogen exchanger 8
MAKIEELGESEEEKDSEKLADWAMMMHVFLLICVFVIGFALSKMDFKYMGEAGAGLIIGAIVGAVLKMTNGTELFKDLVKFNEHIFFLVLLPPIIFEAGYNMKRRYFFRNFGSICSFAFIGTFVSTFLIGTAVYLVGQFGMTVKLDFLEALLFGALISATDPVTVLAVFSKLGADMDLFSFVFGESVLNDAVAIVLYLTLDTFRSQPFTGMACLLGVAQFVEIFCVSFLLGGGYAMLLALWCKKSPVDGDEEREHIQVALVTLTPYMAYLTAESFYQSGIVTILFCGISMSVFVRPNLSQHARDFTSHLAKILAVLFETYVFIYLGMSLFTISQAWETMVMAIYATVICLVARLFNIYPISWMLNKYGGCDIDARKQFTMWFAGLRGAIAFVLAVKAKETLVHGDTILTTTIMVIFFTVFCMGGYIWPLLERFNLRIPAVPHRHNPYHNAIEVLRMANEAKEGLEEKVDDAIEDLNNHKDDLVTDIETLRLIKTGESSRAERDELLTRLRELCHDFDEEDDTAWLDEVSGVLRPLCNQVHTRIKRAVTTMHDNDDDGKGNHVPLEEIKD